MVPLNKNCLLTLIISLLCLAVACAPVPFSQNRPVTPQPPTEAPPATAIPQATSTAALPEGPYATRQAGIQATIEARATVSPFPTALPATVVQGQPSSAQEQRDGLVLEVRLPKDSYLAGEGGLAEVEIRNEGPETVFISGSGSDPASSGLLDERGQQQPDTWPLSFRRNIMGLAYLQKLAPGDVLTKTLQFQVPPIEQNPPSRLDFWAETRFSRQEPGNPEGPDNLWLRLEAGPVGLNIYPPVPANRLRVDWQVDRTGWRLRLKDAAGQVPPGPFWGEIGAASPNSVYSGPLRGGQPEAGEWTGSWDDFLVAGDSQILAGGWVATEGYVTAVFSQILPGEGDAGQMLGLFNLPKRESFSTLRSAQDTLDFRIFALSPVVSGSTLENVQIDRCCGKDMTETSIEQQVLLPGGAWMGLTQMVSSTSYAGAGWGLARYDREAVRVDIHGQPGYAIQRFGWWYLDWKVGETGFELRAPITKRSLPDLLTIARQMTAQQ